jgi:hypothetical protein
MWRYYFVMGFLFLMCAAIVDDTKPLVYVCPQGRATAIDNAGNIYLVDNNYNLKIYKRGIDTFNKIFSLINYGADPIIDVSNALEIFVFFPSTGWVLWFDNQLNMQSKLQLFNCGVAQPVAIGRANDGEIWAFDNNTKTLKKITRHGTIAAESMVLSNFHYQQSNHLVFDDGEVVVLEDDFHSAFAFGPNLGFLGKTELDGILLGIENKELISISNNQLIRKKLLETLSKEKNIYSPNNGVSIKNYNSGKLILRSGDSLLRSEI